MFIVVGGALAVGKTTLVNKLVEVNGWFKQEETVSSHPCLDKFYQALKAYQEQPDITTNRITAHYYSLATQMFFLTDRWMKHNNACISMSDTTHIIADRSIYEDNIFAQLLVQRGELDEKFYNTIYYPMFRTLCNFLREPDVFIFLHASTEVLLSRKAQRDRGIENAISFDYMDALNRLYDNWYINFSKNNRIKFIELNTEFIDYDNPDACWFKLLNCQLNNIIKEGDL